MFEGNRILVTRGTGSLGQVLVRGLLCGAARALDRLVVFSRHEAKDYMRLSHEDRSRRGKTPAIIDMPPMWTHPITSVGADELPGLFWRYEALDPEQPSTYPERVQLANGAA